MGIFAIIAAAAAAKISYRSPNTKTKSDFSCCRASAKPIIAKPIDLLIDEGVSALSSISTLRSMWNPSCSISRYVKPNSGERCIPVAITCSSSCSDSRIPSINQRSRPYSARVPVTTQIFRCFMLSRPCIDPIRLE